MDCFLISGGARLSGTVDTSGSKNAALPIMAAALLADGPVRLARIPQLRDVTTLADVLSGLGVKIERHGSEMTLESDANGPTEADAQLVRAMRASFCVLGPLVARRGRAVAALPGGCQIGERPVDLHLMGLAALGADVRIEQNCVIVTAKRLRGTTLRLTGPRGSTVTGTANILCAATLAQGKTVIQDAASEPEIVDLGHFLIAMGARIDGLGSDVLEIKGIERLQGTRHEIIPDRIETATLLLAGAITGGAVRVTKSRPDHLSSVLEILRQIGMQVECGTDWVDLRASELPLPMDLTALPYPGLPTDLQAQFTALSVLAPGRSVIRDEVFPDRFRHLAELRRMGACVAKQGNSAVIRGVAQLHGAQVTACDLRASAALVLAGLAARGQTVVQHIHHLNRGYEGLDRKLRMLGAEIENHPASPTPVPRASTPIPPYITSGTARSFST